ncbi:hypothetical protein pb186bvf_012849 [Paramecium bursaria]
MFKNPKKNINYQILLEFQYLFEHQFMRKFKMIFIYFNMYIQNEELELVNSIYFQQPYGKSWVSFFNRETKEIQIFDPINLHIDKIQGVINSAMIIVF